ncbi:NADH dehydrogenase (ubiquinone) B17 subunit [Lycorma delicatula]|uniref:NADH dehydrogenase (ubiquinone) B17 subunit n=1 Tax=Lycorma delicatula TaxID=130591 RepID=UPI003F510213
MGVKGVPVIGEDSNPMSIQGRLARERERLLGMTDEERRWRKQWVKDQHLSPNEPRHVPEIYRELNNPIKRLYKAPLDKAFSFTEPYIGKHLNQNIRYITGKLFMITYAAIFGVYWVKYHTNDWTRVTGWRMYTSRMKLLPGDPEYPRTSPRTKAQDYGNQNFKNSPI